MTSKFIASAVLAAAALTSVAASAETFNPYLWEQMKTATTKTRAEVKAELLQAPKDASATTSPSAYYGAADPQSQRASPAGQASAVPQGQHPVGENRRAVNPPCLAKGRGLSGRGPRSVGSG